MLTPVASPDALPCMAAADHHRLAIGIPACSSTTHRPPPTPAGWPSARQQPTGSLARCSPSPRRRVRTGAGASCGAHGRPWTVVSGGGTVAGHLEEPEPTARPRASSRSGRNAGANQVRASRYGHDARGVTRHGQQPPRTSPRPPGHPERHNQSAGRHGAPRPLRGPRSRTPTGTRCRTSSSPGR